MPNEALITRIENILSEVVDIGGRQETTSIITNLEVVDAAPAGIAGFITIKDERDGDTILAKKVPGVGYAAADLVNVLFVNGAEPIAFQQGSQSSGDAVLVSKLVSPDETINPVFSADNSGDVTAIGDIIMTVGTQTYNFTSRTFNIVIQGQSSGSATSLEFFSNDGDGTDLVGFNVYGVGLPADVTNRERLQVRYNPTGTLYEIKVEADGTGTLRDLIIFTEGNSNQVYLNADGNVGIGTASQSGKLDVSGDFALSGGSQVYLLSDRSTSLTLQGQSAGTTTNLEFYTFDGDGTDVVGFNIFGIGDPSDLTNRERLQLRYNPTGTLYEMFTEADGTGTLRDLIIYTEGNTNQIFLDTSGDVGISAGVPAAQLHVDQASTTAAQPTLYLDQADISEEMIEFNTTIGVGNAIEAVGAKTLTVTHFIKITIPGPLTRYIQAGTIA